MARKYKTIGIIGASLPSLLFAKKYSKSFNIKLFEKTENIGGAWRNINHGNKSIEAGCHLIATKNESESDDIKNFFFKEYSIRLHVPNKKELIYDSLDWKNNNKAGPPLIPDRGWNFFSYEISRRVLVKKNIELISCYEVSNWDVNSSSCISVDGRSEFIDHLVIPAYSSFYPEEFGHQHRAGVENIHLIGNWSSRKSFDVKLKQFFLESDKDALIDRLSFQSINKKMTNGYFVARIGRNSKEKVGNLSRTELDFSLKRLTKDESLTCGDFSVLRYKHLFPSIDMRLALSLKFPLDSTQKLWYLNTGYLGDFIYENLIYNS